jgi:hypothetical protein
MRRRVHGLALALAAWPQLAAAQPAQTAPPRWQDRARITISAGVQGNTLPLRQSLELTKYVEPAPITADVPRAAVPLFDLGAQLRLQRNLGVAVSVSYLTGTYEAAVAGEIPHPLYFGQPRAISGRTSRVSHGELVVHTNLVYMLPVRSVDMFVFGGASFFRVEQDFVTDVHFNETYPYDTAVFSRADLLETSARQTGVNVGADLTWRLGAGWGLGGLVRYSHANVAFDVDGIDVGTPRVGGVEAAGGLRIVLPVRRTARR